jgi:hypothetical protein
VHLLSRQAGICGTSIRAVALNARRVIQFLLGGDILAGSRNRAKREYFSRAIDADRVMFTYGRDIRLSAEQKGEPLNYFIYRYAESNGQAIKGLQTHFTFRDLEPGA